MDDDLPKRLRDPGNLWVAPQIRVRDLCLEAADELERLRDERREWLGQRVGYEESLHGQAGANGELRAEVAALKQRCRALEGLLAPFAEFARVNDGHPSSAGLGDGSPVTLDPADVSGRRPNLGDCRAAAAALAAGPTPADLAEIDNGGE